MLLVILTASLGYLFEHEAQPDKFENIPQSIYWAVITLASVGYGDISPITPAGRIMTIILALLGIGIFAIPAALLSSAFSDQLRIERDTLKSELYQMMADGVIDEEERVIIHREAKRLHISHEEVERMIQRARQEHELKEDVSVLPLHKIASNPAHAMEYYRETLSRLLHLLMKALWDQLRDRQSLQALDPGALQEIITAAATQAVARIRRDCAIGDVLVDQLSQMQRCGFSSAVLRADQDLAKGHQLLSHYSAFYQGDTLQPLPLFAR